MQIRTDAICFALARCEAWYAARGQNVRAWTERSEELWFEIDDLVKSLVVAEREGNEQAAIRYVDAVLRCALAVCGGAICP